MYRNPLRRRLAAGESTLGLWITLEAPAISELAAALGIHWVVLDTEHGHLGHAELVAHLRALRGSNTAALVRVPQLDAAAIQRALDLRADGVIVPQVRGADDVAAAVRMARFPPAGERGVGGERSVLWGLDWDGYLQSANDEVMVIPLVEHVRAGAVIREILAVPGVDAIFLGPADYSASAGHLGAWEGPGIAEELLRIRGCCEDRGVPCGVMATGEADLSRRLEQGFRMVGLGSDTGLLIRAARAALAAAGHGR